MTLLPKFALAFSGSLALAACGQASDGRSSPEVAKTGNTVSDVYDGDVSASPNTPASPTPTAGVSATPPPGYTDGSGINEGYPDLTPAQLTPEAARGEAGARDVLVLFARAIEMREYDQAWAMLGSNAKATWSTARFNALFDGLRDITVAVPGGTMEGAAGSGYYTSQATVTASDADGRPIRLEGPLVLRRVNEVPGSSEEQRRWRFETVALSVTH